MLKLDALATLPAARQTWCCARGSARMASKRSRAPAWSTYGQARSARSDARLLVRLGGREVRRYRGLLLLRDADNNDRDAEAFRWNGESEIALPAWGGVCASTARPTVKVLIRWLAAKPPEVKLRRRALLPYAGRPSRTLYQDAGIVSSSGTPAHWARQS
jgi:hypothetical protein